MLMEGRRPDSVKFNLLIRFNTKERTTVSIIPPPYPSLIQAGPLFPHASSRALSFTRDTSALSGCDDWEARRLRRRGLESWGGGDCTQGLVNGYTMCRETRSSTLQQTALSSQRERQSGRVREREGERVIILPLCLSVIIGEHTDARGPKRWTYTQAHAGTDRHTHHAHACTQTKTHVENKEMS